MKKTFFILISILLIAVSSSAQFIEEDYNQEVSLKKKYVLKVDPTLWFFGPIPGTGDYRLSLELATSLKSSFQIGASYVTKSIFTLIVEGVTPDSAKGPDYSVNGFRFQLAYKFYPFGKYQAAPAGVFVGPHISYTYAGYHISQTSNKYSDYSVVYANAALIWGYQAILGDKVAIEIFSGVGYRSNWMRDEYTGKTEKLNYNPQVTPFPGDFKIYLGVNIGAAF